MDVPLRDPLDETREPEVSAQPGFQDDVAPHHLDVERITGADTRLLDNALGHADRHTVAPFLGAGFHKPSLRIYMVVTIVALLPCQRGHRPKNKGESHAGERGRRPARRAPTEED